MQNRSHHTLSVFYKILAREMKVSRATAVAVSGFLLTCVVERLSTQEAKHLISGLPKLLQEGLLEIKGSNRKITPRFILQHLDEDFGFDTRTSYQLVRGFWNGLDYFFMGRETNHVLKQFSKELQTFFTGEKSLKNSISSIARSI